MTDRPHRRAMHPPPGMTWAEWAARPLTAAGPSPGPVTPAVVRTENPDGSFTVRMKNPPERG